MSSARRCLDPIDLARAASEAPGGEDVHLAACGACRADVEAQRRLAALAGSLPAPEVSADRVDAVRTAVLAAVCAPPAPPRAWPRRAAAVGAAAAAAALIAAGVWHGRGALGPPPAPRAAAPAAVQAHPGARFAQAGGPPDQIVRLSEGTLTVSVSPMGPGERFRVIVGGAEVEVRGTAFDVTARADRLLEVRVHRGRVAVRPDGASEVLLQPGERWSALEEPAAAPAAPATPLAAASAEPPRAAPPPRVKAPPAPRLLSRSEARRPAPMAAPVAVAVEPRAALAAAPPGGAPSRAGPAQGPEADPPAPAQAQGLSPAEEAFEQGFALLRSGAPAEAAYFFERAARSSGAETLGEDASYWRAVALGRAARAEEAARAFRSFLDAFPGSNRSGEAEAILGRLLLSQGDAAGARLLFQAASNDAAPRVRKAAMDGLELTRELIPESEPTE